MPSLDDRLVRQERAPRVRAMSSFDLADVVDLHELEFPESVFTRLGRQVSAAYLATFIRGPHAVAVVATDEEDRMMGYLVGILDVAQHRSWLKASCRPFLVSVALVGVGRHPLLTGRLVARRLRLRWGAASRGVEGARRPPDGSATAPDRPAVLSYVAVLAGARRQGIGSCLIDQLQVSAVAAGATRATLATSSGGAACAYYEGRGWQLERRRRTADGRELSLYTRALVDDGGLR